MIGKGIAAVHSLPEGAAARFDAFHALLTAWNRRMDLTAVTDDTEALHRHYLDSLTALDLLPQGARVVDVGTGAGFPGVPLALARPDIAMTLLDALEKRVRFLTHAAETIGLRAEAVHARAEDYAKERREMFDVAVSRAVASLPVLLEWLLPLVRIGGQCILWKGPGLAAELEGARRVSPLLGGGAVRVADAPVAGRELRHVLVVVSKDAPTPARFPRRAGMAVKRPLREE
ncbi:MAG: 16S rRNA (guanine(527)-N(7))-methyltransferase RsmG [Firmicutes bacterium]|nr:16S rRNA (guanine(527)-N(7))-methyltransferase RsmG [Bacillota bacterium]